LIPLKHGVMPTLANLPFAFDEPFSFKGIAGNKLEVLSSYHASLVIENDSSSLSEKLVDCILAGTIPVYVGSPTSPFGFPESLIIRSEADIESLTRAPDLALEIDSQESRSRAWSWASQASSRENWSDEYVGTLLLPHIVSQITNNSTRGVVVSIFSRYSRRPIAFAQSEFLRFVGSFQVAIHTSSIIKSLARITE